MADLPSKVRPKFFRNDAGAPYVEISIVGDPNTVIRKVTPDDTVRFAKEWMHFEQTNGGEVKIDGTPLTEVPGVDRDASLSLMLRGIRTAEELAGLDEAAARALGMGGLTFWQGAKLLMRLREAEAMQAVLEAAPRRGRPPKVETTETA